MTHSSSPLAALQLISQDKAKNNFWALDDKNNYRLGRGKANDIVLPFTWVSRQHAMLQKEDNGLFNLIDLGSSNGTFVNGKRVYTPFRLLSNDKIKIGDSNLIFSQQEVRHSPVPPCENDDPEEQTIAFMQTEIVTIMVCDIRGYTTLSEELGDQNLSKLLGYWTKKVNAIVLKNNGQVDKFIGDAVMAVWQEDAEYANILQALKTIVEICLISRKLGKKLPFLQRELHVGGAINTGQAVMGNMGVDGQRDYTIIGDVVNVTFRLEDMTVAHRFDVIIGAETFKNLPDAARYFSPREYTLKGKSGATQAYGCSFHQLYEYLKGRQSLK